MTLVARAKVPVACVAGGIRGHERMGSLKYRLPQRRLDSRPQSIMGIERLIPRVTSLTVDCRGVNISLPIWKLSNDNSARL